jgi:hypothetical protein
MPLPRVITFETKLISEPQANVMERNRLRFDSRHYDLVIGSENVDVVDERGAPLLILRHRALPAAICEESLPALRRIAKPNKRRWGESSGSFGFLERGGGFNYCRCTPFTRDDPEGWNAVLSLVQALALVYRTALPEAFAVQMQYAQLTHEDFRIDGTPWTSGTVNRNAVFPAHRDDGNLSLGASVMAVLRRGKYSGGLFVLPEYRLAVDAHDRDVILFSSDLLHGNTAFAGAERTHERVSVVVYYRRGMLDCGSAAEENARANKFS